MANSTEIRRILINSIVSVNDENNVSEVLGFRHTLNGSLKPFNLHLTSSLSENNTDIITQNYVNTLIKDREEVLPKQQRRSDSTTQVYNIDVPTGQAIVTGSVSLIINGLEQQTTEDQKTHRVSGSDYFLSGSRFEQLVLYKPRGDHSGILVDNSDTLLIKYRAETIIG